MSTGRYRLGLDVGSNSLGWALLELDQTGQPNALADGGVLIFSDGRDARKREPLNVIRRTKRGLRRRVRAAKWRRDRLLALLKETGLADTPDANERTLYAGSDGRPSDPYKLRADALSRPLTAPELVRVLLHLARHRGFKSNALRQTAEDTNDLKFWGERERDLRQNMARGPPTTSGLWATISPATLPQPAWHARFCRSSTSIIGAMFTVRPKPETS